MRGDRISQCQFLKMAKRWKVAILWQFDHARLDQCNGVFQPQLYVLGLFLVLGLVSERLYFRPPNRKLMW